MRHLAFALLLLASPAAAQELRIGMKGVVDSPDPHQSYSPNRNVQLHVYETLVTQDAQLRPHPLLAESWRAIDPLTWEFTLRPGVAFHNGDPLTAADAAFSVMRAKSATGIRTYAQNVRRVTRAEATGPRTLVLHMEAPTPLQPALMSGIAIVQAAAVGDAPTPAEWNGGKAAVGTGPYRWIKWTTGSDVKLERNDAYWGGAQPWERVTFRFIQNDSARVAALLAGDIDIADTLPAELYDRVKTEQSVKLVTTDSVFTDYLYLDSNSPVIANATGADGKPLPVNPLRDERVRAAIDHALNRPVLAERAMQGGATAAGQVAPKGLIGHVDGLPLPAFDPALSRRLLAEAGYPAGFGLVMTCTNDRFAGDSRACITIGQMLSAVGIKTDAQPTPAALYFRRYATIGPNGSSEYSATISMFGSTTGIASEGLNNMVHTAVPAKGQGAGNRNFVSDPKLDAMLETLESTFDDAERERLTEAAVRYTMDHHPGRAAVPPESQLGPAPGPHARPPRGPVHDGHQRA